MLWLTGIGRPGREGGGGWGRRGGDDRRQGREGVGREGRRAGLRGQTAGQLQRHLHRWGGLRRKRARPVEGAVQPQAGQNTGGDNNQRTRQQPAQRRPAFYDCPVRRRLDNHQRDVIVPGARVGKVDQKFGGLFGWLAVQRHGNFIVRYQVGKPVRAQQQDVIIEQRQSLVGSTLAFTSGTRELPADPARGG